ncbi:hypothetical protein L6R50_21735 [Myxococcota bacterium]|nr:hypothetical protein [Myxococcota bacterium]
MSARRTADGGALLDRLAASGVEFVVVGGYAAVLHGAPITTRDLDIVPRRDPDNARRLLAALEAIDAVYHDPLGRALRPRAEDFLGRGQPCLRTSLGDLDVLCVLHDGRDYDDLVRRSDEFEVDDLRIRVLDLPTLIEVKAGTGRAKDRIMVPILLAVLRERETAGRG